MSSTLSYAILQPPPSRSAGAEPSGDGGPVGGCGDGLPSLLPLVAILVAMYFLILRPQQKRQREQEAMLKALRKGMVVRTTGGIRGEITDLTDRDVTLLIADKTRINVLRANVLGPEPEPNDQSASKNASKKDS